MPLNEETKPISANTRNLFLNNKKKHFLSNMYNINNNHF